MTLILRAIASLLASGYLHTAPTPDQSAYLECLEEHDIEADENDGECVGP